VVDQPDDHQRVIDFVDSVLQPKLKSRVEAYDGIEPIFDHFGIENQVNRALERRVWLKSGGYLVFDQTEALTTIDVNTGRFVGKKTHEETVLKTNLEAPRVAIDQLRLRNIGGIIIIDFIDMEKAANRKRRSARPLAEAVKRDKARTNILRISELGLVQMTRKRTRDNLRQLITTPCTTCGGDGRLKSVGTLASEVLRMVRRQVATANDVERVTLTVASEVGSAPRGPLRAGVDELIRKLGVRVNVRLDAKLPRDRSEIRSRPPRTRRALRPTATRPQPGSSRRVSRRRVLSASPPPAQPGCAAVPRSKRR
jgi:ribonuclease G